MRKYGRANCKRQGGAIKKATVTWSSANIRASFRLGVNRYEDTEWHLLRESSLTDWLANTLKVMCTKECRKRCFCILQYRPCHKFESKSNNIQITVTLWSNYTCSCKVYCTHVEQTCCLKSSGTEHVECRDFIVKRRSLSDTCIWSLEATSLAIFDYQDQLFDNKNFRFT